jgi:Rrf2 family protein
MRPAWRIRDNLPMRVTAKADYAVRAAVELTAASEQSPRKADSIAAAQDIPLSFLENILNQLKSAGLVRSQRGPEGGWWLAHPGSEIKLADVIRAVEGPLASVRGERPEAVTYNGLAAPLQEVWIALRANLRGVLDHVSLADVAAGELPAEIGTLVRDQAAWR